MLTAPITTAITGGVKNSLIHNKITRPTTINALPSPNNH